MEQINKNAKNCATCAYWLGERNPHRLGYVEVFSRMDTGRCGAKGLNESREYQATYTCSKHYHWRLLK